MVKHRVTELHLSKLFRQTWDIVVVLLVHTNDIDKTKSCVYKAKHPCHETNYFLLNPANVNRATKYGFVAHVWLPLLKVINSPIFKNR
ncbi:unnamed protein product [Rhizopus stolonifer]